MHRYLPVQVHTPHLLQCKWCSLYSQLFRTYASTVFLSAKQYLLSLKKTSRSGYRTACVLLLPDCEGGCEHDIPAPVSVVRIIIGLDLKYRRHVHPSGHPSPPPPLPHPNPPPQTQPTFRIPYTPVVANMRTAKP